MLNLMLSPMGINVAAPEEEGSQELQVVITLGMALPFEQAPGAGPVMVPFTQVILPLDKTNALQLAKTLTDAAEKLQKKSDLTIANSLGGVDKMAQFQSGLK